MTFKPLLPLLGLLLSSCGVTLTVAERKGRELVVEKAGIQAPLRYRQGNADHVADLKKIKRLYVLSDFSRVYDDRIYYGADIWLTDGSHLPFIAAKEWEKAAVKDSAQLGLTYVDVSGVIQGKVSGEKFSIELMDVRWLALREKTPPPPPPVKADSAAEGQ